MNFRIRPTLTAATALAVSFFSPAAKAEPLIVGATAPALKAVDENGKSLDLAEVYRKGTTLVYFYPKADTPGCTKQACNLRDAFTQLTDKGVTVIGVNMDKPADQKAFKEKYKLPFTLIADEKGDLVRAFGVPEIRAGFPSRQSFLVGKDGKIFWRDLKAVPDKQAEAAVKALEGAKAGTATAPAAGATVEKK